MNGIIRYIIGINALLTVFCLGGCADDALVDNPKGEGRLLNMYANVNTVNTRLAELGNASNMFTDAKGKKNIGLYIYYEDDYSGKNSANGKADLSKPYIRNLECIYEDGKIVPISKENIYIYDRMTIVAFYPYNAAMSEEANYFTVKDDEKAYPISESDYSQQLYIPYRAQTNVNPTNAYMINLGFGPQQTCKVEVVLVADKLEDFPQSKNLTDGKIKLLPTVDRYEGAYNSTTGDLRENWLDGIKDFPADDEFKQGTPIGGKYVRRYTAYVWKSGASDKHHDLDHKHSNNTLPKGEVLFESDKLILRVPALVNLDEETVYRYGYNMNTGEIFIPTSDRLVYDAASLQGVKFDEYRAYQVCDIDVSSIANWTPKTAFKGIYDGGGHQITGLKLSVSPSADIDSKIPDKQSFGLFSQITSESTLMNIELINPVITVNFSNTALKDICYVGALCGLINPELSEAQKRKMIEDGLPPELSGPVKEALIQERLKDFAQTICYIRGCKVTDPAIIVTGENVRVGGLCGGAGNQLQKAEIKDSYVWQNDNTAYQGILVNATSDEIKSKYNNAFVAGFCGLLANSGNNGGITNCYSTLEKVQAFVKDATASKDIATGFYHPATGEELQGTVTVSGCYTLKVETNTGVTNFANGNPTSWPLFENDKTVTNGGVGSSNVTNYPGAYPAYKWTDSWKDMDGNHSYPSLIWETRLLMPLN